MERFPSLERASNAQAAQHQVRTPDYHHTAEIIFAFPSLQLHLKSEHLQTGAVPLLTGNFSVAFIFFFACPVDINFLFRFSEPKPNVVCSFITDFEDHIFVTVDADAFFFLHDLITSYVREKERVVCFKKSLKKSITLTFLRG